MKIIIKLKKIIFKLLTGHDYDTLDFKKMAERQLSNNTNNHE